MPPKERERMFFGISDMSAWKFSGIHMLNILYLLNDKKALHGRGLQQLLRGIFDEIWTPGNDLTYTILNTYEEEGYVRSSWQDNIDSNKRYIRYYKITDKGIDYFNDLKTSFQSTLKVMQQIFDYSLEYIWGDPIMQPLPLNPKTISSSSFTTINILNFMYREKYNLTAEKILDASLISNKSSNVSGWMYGKEIKDNLQNKYAGIWRPSDGVMYPLLSNLDTDGYLSSKWADNAEYGFKKKRTVREYIITEKGEDLLKALLSQESGLKNKIIKLKTLCIKSIDIIYGNSTLNISNIESLISKYCA